MVGRVPAISDYFSQAVDCMRCIIQDIVISLEGELKEKIIKFALNLIRYPNSITSYFIDFVTTLIFKANHEKTRNLLLAKMFERINIESAHPWGMLYLVNQLQAQKN